MKTLIKLNYVMLFTILLFGCSIEDSVETNENNSTNLEQKESTTIVTQQIEFYLSLPESTKDDIRNFYKQNGILIKHTICKNGEETWWVNCDGCKQSNPPIDKDDHPDEMREALLYQKCKD